MSRVSASVHACGQNDTGVSRLHCEPFVLALREHFTLLRATVCLFVQSLIQDAACCFRDVFLVCFIVHLHSYCIALVAFIRSPLQVAVISINLQCIF